MPMVRPIVDSIPLWPEGDAKLRALALAGDTSRPEELRFRVALADQITWRDTPRRHDDQRLLTGPFFATRAEGEPKAVIPERKIFRQREPEERVAAPWSLGDVAVSILQIELDSPRPASRA